MVEQPVMRGYVESGNVQDALRAIQSIAPYDGKVVIRSLDSERSTKAIEAAINRLAGVDAVAASNGLLELGRFYSYVAPELTGFDEVWLFTGNPKLARIQEMSSGTSEAFRFDQEVPQDLLRAFESSNCIVMLADGIGLNYLTKDREIERLLRQLEKDV